VPSRYGAATSSGSGKEATRFNFCLIEDAVMDGDPREYSDTTQLTKCGTYGMVMWSVGTNNINVSKGAKRTVHTDANVSTRPLTTNRRASIHILASRVACSMTN
jgi:hypothetical protein